VEIYLCKDTAITLLYINFDNNFAMRGTTIHSKPRLIPLLYRTRGATLKKCLVSKFCPSLFKLARVTSLHIIMPYVNEWRHYAPSFVWILIINEVVDTHHLKLHHLKLHHLTPPHPPPQKSGSKGTYITTYRIVVARGRGTGGRQWGHVYPLLFLKVKKVPLLCVNLLGI
jgi:hypothetical protein